MKCAIDIRLDNEKSIWALDTMKEGWGSNILIRADRFSNNRQRIYWDEQKSLDAFFEQFPSYRALVVFWLADKLN